MNEAQVANRKLMRKLFVIAVCMFGFAYALVPFYEVICKLTGSNNLLKADVVQNTQVDKSRTVIIEFDANTHKLAWNFKPTQNSLTVHLGEIVQVTYEVRNTKDVPVSGQAIPSYGPALAGKYFRKLDCFCFTKQTLAANERKQMPVVFVVDPSLPKDVNVITLSYTFFEVAGSQATNQAEPAVKEGELRGGSS